MRRWFKPNQTIHQYNTMHVFIFASQFFVSCNTQLTNTYYTHTNTGQISAPLLPRTLTFPSMTMHHIVKVIVYIKS